MSFFVVGVGGKKARRLDGGDSEWEQDNSRNEITVYETARLSNFSLLTPSDAIYGAIRRM